MCLVDTVGMSKENKNFVMRKSVKAFSDSLLDLIVETPETAEGTLDYFGKPEVLYLGPDEQVLPEDINWIVQRAAKRGYRNPSAFMSSKPKAGINHKEVRKAARRGTRRTLKETRLRPLRLSPPAGRVPPFVTRRPR